MSVKNYFIKLVYSLSPYLEKVIGLKTKKMLFVKNYFSIRFLFRKRPEYASGIPEMKTAGSLRQFFCCVVAKGSNPSCL
jgi:hypothetical protein